MTVWSQNGLTANDRSVIRSALIPGTAIKVSVRVGPVGDLLLYAAGRWHREVEPLEGGTPDEWGYAERTIRGSLSELSNHASGSALDLNATKHPLGTNPAANFTAAQISAIRKIVVDCKGCLRWGGDYIGRKDPMHIETLGSEQAISEVMTVLTEGGGTDDMALTERDIQTLIARLLGAQVPDRFPATVTRNLSLQDTFVWAAANAGRAEEQTKACRKELAAIAAHLGITLPNTGVPL